MQPELIEGLAEEVAWKHLGNTTTTVLLILARADRGATAAALHEALLGLGIRLHLSGVRSAMAACRQEGWVQWIGNASTDTNGPNARVYGLTPAGEDEAGRRGAILTALLFDPIPGVEGDAVVADSEMVYLDGASMVPIEDGGAPPGWE